MYDSKSHQQKRLAVQAVSCYNYKLTIVYGVDCLRKEVMLMEKLSFQDLMAFGMFLIALLMYVDKRH